MKRACAVLVAVCLVAGLAVVMPSPVYATTAGFTALYVPAREWGSKYAADYPYMAVYYDPHAYNNYEYLTIIYSKTAVIQAGQKVKIVTYRYTNNGGAVTTTATTTADRTFGQIYVNPYPALPHTAWIYEQGKTTIVGYAGRYSTLYSTAKTWDHNNVQPGLVNPWEWHDDHLRLPSTANLQKLIDTCDAIQNTGYGYTTVSWNNFQTRLAEAKEVIARGWYTAAHLTTAQNNLNSAKNGLVLNPDPSALLALIDQCAAIPKGNYTPSSWNAMQTAINNARNLVNSGTYTTAQLNQHITTLTNAKSNLKLLPDTAELRALLAECEKITDTGFTTSSWTRLQTAITTARNVLAKGEYTQNEVTNALNGLTTARNGLVALPDSSALRMLLAQCEALPNDDYTVATWTVFQSAITSARLLLNGGEYTAAQVQSSYNALQAALDGLLQLPNTERLEALVRACEALDQDEYKPSTWTPLRRALDNAKALLARTDFTEAEVAAVYDALFDAQGGLEKKPSTDALREQLMACKFILNAGYSTDSWQTLQEAIRAADALLAGGEYSEADVRNALTDLSTARNGLRLLPSPEGLRAMIAQAELIQPEGYAPESWERLQKAIASARSLLDSGSYTDTQISSAVSSINQAITSLTGGSPVDLTPPAGHRYLVDGVLPADLLPAQEAIFQNIRWGEGAAIWAFGAIFIVYLGIRLVRSFVGIQGEARFIDLNEPSGASSYKRDAKTGRVRKKRGDEE